ncbi:MAG TPA: pilus assembly protein TadG-related protein [Phenylobacterium sp.]|nr:pilus assembly protein TadG-related protein [Phenylobacterium sp.]
MGWRAPRALSAFRADRRGGIATIFAIGAPVVAMFACGAIDLFAVHSSRTALQDAADAAALAAAKQIGMTDEVGIKNRAEIFVRQQAASAAKDVNYTVASTIDVEASTVTVHIDGVRDSFFGNLLPPGGWKIKINSTATRVSQVPLCVLATGEDSGNKIDVKDQAQLTAPKCLVHTNSNMEVSNNGWMNTAIAQASGWAKGRISPEPQTDAPTIADPFAGMSISTDQACPLVDSLVLALSNIQLGGLLPPIPVQPGVHCVNVTVQKNVTLRLQPGEHYFKKGDLQLLQNAKIEGQDVVLIFDKDAKFKFGDQSQINLEGRRSGDFAGFVIATTPENTNTFEISTTAARELLGTVYIPGAKLALSGTNTQVTDQADWTVIVAKAIEMTGSPNLVLNTNYQGSPVPVPAGVGPVGGEVRLGKPPA